MPPRSRVYYQTCEFHCFAAINSLGFRDKEVGAEKKKKLRLVAIGDSFTYGWGVDLQDTWPKILEKNLQDRGLSLEILNFGKPGASPVEYAEMAEIAIPLLRPDVIILAVLQAEDLWQLKVHYLDCFWTKGFLWEYLFPNLRQLRISRNLWKARGKVFTAEHTREYWEKEAQDLQKRINHEEQARLMRLKAPLKKAFMRGETNPYIIVHAVMNPQMYRDTFDPKSPLVQKLTAMLTNQLMRIKKLADHHKIRVIVCSVPTAVFVSKTDYLFAQGLGFLLDKKMMELNNMDELIKKSSLKAGLPAFVEVTDSFRAKCQKESLYYLWDEHFNRTGYRFYADSLMPYMMEFLSH
ncbi:MAG: SGNH/GDSL hydrolase family protein [Thermodesulfobacteriota bacterium]